jgi:hypothetical protein
MEGILAELPVIWHILVSLPEKQDICTQILLKNFAGEE